MTAPFFYGDAVELSSAAVGTLLTLSGDEGRHAVTVKRLGIGEPILVGDGRGVVAHAVVEQITSKSELCARVDQLSYSARPEPSVTVVQALIKGDRMERAIETLTEAGVDRIVLWQSQRSIVRVDQNSSGKLTTKLANRAEQAAKQARRPLVPELVPVVRSSALVGEVCGDESKERVVLVLHEAAHHSLSEVLVAGALGDAEVKDLVLIVGPEGGITPEELADLTAAGAQPVRLGPTVMRASTAGTVALGWVMGAVGRWAMAD